MRCPLCFMSDASAAACDAVRFISLRHMTSASVVATSRASTLAAPGADAPFTFQYPIIVSWWHGASVTPLL
jgi:hypothetical protein